MKETVHTLKKVSSVVVGQKQNSEFQIPTDIIYLQRGKKEVNEFKVAVSVYVYNVRVYISVLIPLLFLFKRSVSDMPVQFCAHMHILKFSKSWCVFWGWHYQTKMGLVSGMMLGIMFGIGLMAIWRHVMRYRSTKRIAKVCLLSFSMFFCFCFHRFPEIKFEHFERGSFACIFCHNFLDRQLMSN